MSKTTIAAIAKKEHIREFWCLSCDAECKVPPMKPLAAIAHLKEKHGLEKASGTKNALSFLDGGDGYTNTYEWEFDGLKLMEVASGPREYPGSPD